MASLCQSASAVPAEVFINQLVQDYNGTSKFPGISTNPPGLSVDVAIVPRSQSEVVFQTIPTVPEPSYASFGLESLPTDKAFGEELNLGGSNRLLESVDVAMVNVAKASNWPTLAAENPEGYLHPLTIIVYSINGSDLTLLAQQTQQTLIPWRPAALDDGSEYPFGGIGFNVRFDFNETVTLTGTIAVLVAYNTASSGFAPIGLPGPYNDLKVALQDSPPTLGSDVDETRMLRFVTGISKSKAFGTSAPLFTVRTFPANPAPGTPLDAGRYRVSATLTESGYEGSARANFQVTPLAAEVSFATLRQVAEGTPKPVAFTTIPPGLPAHLVYARRSGPPLERGLYPVFVTLSSVNYAGKSSATLRLGYSYDTWIAEKVALGDVPPALAGKSHDPDLDGHTNFTEYLSSTNPSTFTPGSPELLALTRDGNAFKVAFSRNNEAIDLDYQLQVTADFTDPSSWTNLTFPTASTAPFTAQDEIEVVYPLSPSAPSEFFRLKFTTQGF